MKFAISSLLWILLLTCSALSQTASDAPHSFHVQGTIKLHPWVPAGEQRIMKEYDGSAINVTFESGSFSRTVTANGEGFYEAELPFGNYVMKVQNWHRYGECRFCAHQPGQSTYERQLFRVTSPLKLVFNLTLPGGFQKQELRLPAKDGTPFRLAVRYGDYRHGFTGTIWFDYDPRTGDPVFVEYNLCSLQASHVVYHKKQKTIEATGDVIFDDGSGKQETYDPLFLKIEDGTLTPIKGR